MNTNSNSIEIKIDEKTISDNESEYESESDSDNYSSDDEDEFIEVNNEKIYKIYNEKIKYFKKENYIKLSNDGKFLLSCPKYDKYDNTYDSRNKLEFTKVNLNLLVDPINADNYGNTFFRGREIEILNSKSNNKDYELKQIKNEYTLDKISKVKNPWLLNNEFNEDGFYSFIDWFKYNDENKIIYNSLENIIKTVETRLIRFNINYIKEEVHDNFHLYKIENVKDHFTLKNFIDEQHIFSERISDHKDDQIKKNLHHKISNEKWWKLHSENYNDKISCIRCCPNKDYLCTFNIPYYSFFVISVLFGFCLQLSDISSDIYVLIDLYSEEIYYFYCCLSILILTSIVNSVLSMILTSNGKTKPGQTISELLKISDINQSKNKKKIFLNFILGFFQLNIFNELFYSLKNQEKTHSFIWGRCLEGLLESAPQSLFQLFIVLKTSESKSMMNIGRYYFSICSSILSLSIGLVTFEIYRYRMTEYKRIPGVKELTYFSKYIITLTFFRLFEISSRMIFVALLSYITKSGFSIIFFLLTDVIMSGYLQYLIDYIPVDKKYKTQTYIICKKQVEDSKYNCDKSTILFKQFIFIPFMKLGNLASLWLPFTSKMYQRNISGGRESQGEFENADMYHYQIKFITDLFCVGMIIYKLIEGDYNTSFLVLSSISLSGFVLKNILLYYIKRWTKNIKYNNHYFNTDYIKIFKPIKIECFNNCFKKCCGSKETFDKNKKK